MHLAFSATNPCHIYDLLRELSYLDAKIDFYSGYPEWRLNKPLPIEPSKIISRSFHTLITYSLLRLPQNIRPHQDTLFAWQDTHFDQAVAKSLKKADCIHGLPGQCLHTFRRAQELNVPRILNHASGPVKTQIEKLIEESKHLAIPFSPPRRFNSDYFKREQEEYNLADFHVVASSVVAEQLKEYGIRQSKILTIPYGANEHIFKKRQLTPEGPYKILFAGVQNLRKGIPHLLKALEITQEKNWECHFYGHRSDEVEPHFNHYKGKTKLVFHGAVSQEKLSQAMAQASILILPSVEEAFGLVVAQALQVGLPCIVSHNTGSKDLILPRKNGSIVTHNNPEQIHEELLWWANNRKTVKQLFTWKKPATQFLDLHKAHISQ